MLLVGHTCCHSISKTTAASTAAAATAATATFAAATAATADTTATERGAEGRKLRIFVPVVKNIKKKKLYLVGSSIISSVIDVAYIWHRMCDLITRLLMAKCERAGYTRNVDDAGVSHNSLHSRST